VGEAEVVFRGWCTECRRSERSDTSSPPAESLVT